MALRLQKLSFRGLDEFERFEGLTGGQMQARQAIGFGLALDARHRLWEHGGAAVRSGSVHGDG